MPRLPLIRTSAATIAVALAAGATHAQCTMPKHTAADRAANDFFASAIAMSPSIVNGSPRMMVGSPADDTAAGVNAGSVYTFAKLDNNQPWGQMEQFFASDGQPNDFFGVSVGMSDPYAVIGATGAGASGAAYFFERQINTWVQVGKVTPAGSELGADTGRSVAISGTRAIVGAPLKDVSGQANAGAAYIYERQANGTWSLRATITSSPSFDIANQQLGAAVAIHNDLAVIGIPRAELVNWPADHGVIHLYRRDAQGNWGFDRALYSNNPGAGDHYGSAVSTDGTTIAIGAPNDDRTAAQGGALTDSGCVYIQRFINGQWHIDGQLFAADAADSARFGSSVAVHGDRVVIGASGAKKAYVFRRIGAGNWVQDAVLSDPDGNHGFAGAVGFDGTFAMIGDPSDVVSGLTNAGAVYEFRPSNFVSDSCEGARAITPGTWTGCTGFASRDGTTTCGAPAIQGPDVWYAWTPTCTGTATISTAGSAFDTVLSVHSGCPDGAGSSTIVCNDDEPGSGGTSSLVTFSYTAGTRYLIRIAGYNGARGAYEMNLSAGPAPVNNSCQTAQTIGYGVHEFATCSASNSGFPECGAFDQQIYRDVWFRFTAAGTTTVVSLCGSSFDTKLAVYNAAIGCPTGPQQAIACNDDAPAGSPCAGSLNSHLSLATVAGQDYFIRVGGFGTGNGSTGNARLTLSGSAACPADYNADGVVNSNDISAFLSAWLASVQGGTLVADFNADGVVNSNDISAYLSAWLAAVQTGC